MRSLDLCAEALHLFNEAKRSRAEADLAYDELNKEHRHDRIDSPAHQKWQQLCAEAYQGNLKAKTLLRRIAKLRAMTPAGIYAKALVVQASVTGAAKSMAEDFIANKELRASLWPADRERVPDRERL